MKDIAAVIAFAETVRVMRTQQGPPTEEQLETLERATGLMNGDGLTAMEFCQEALDHLVAMRKQLRGSKDSFECFKTSEALIGELTAFLESLRDASRLNSTVPIPLGKSPLNFDDVRQKALRAEARPKPLATAVAA